MTNYFALTWERNEYGKKVRNLYESHKLYDKRKNMRHPKVREGGLCGTISTVLHDNHILEVTIDK